MDDAKGKMIVFVYGTLKKGFHNHYCLSDYGAVYLGNAKTVPAYTLYSCGAYPAMVCSEKANGVTGELYEVDEKVVSRVLDRLEGVPHLYVRHEVSLQSVQLVEEIDTVIPDKVLAYLYNRELGNRPLVGEKWTH